MSLPSLNIEAIAVEKAAPINAVAVVGPVTTKSINGGYESVAITLYYPPEEAGATYSDLEQLSEQLEQGDYSPESAKSLGLRTFTARWNLRPEWFDADFRLQIDNGLVDDNEKMQYSINMSGLTRGLFKSLGQNAIDFNEITGALVGFKASAGKKEPDRLQIRSFYRPSRNK